MRAANAQDRLEWIRAVLDRYEAPLTLYATRLVGDAHRARDVVQDVFVRLCREERATWEGHLSPWLYAVTRNRAMDERRKESAVTRAHAALRNGAAVPAPVPPDPSSAVDARDSAALAVKALAHLPEQQQEALRLRLQHGLSYAEIAEVMGTTKGNVAVLAHRGLTTLRAWFARGSRPATPVRGEIR